MEGLLDALRADDRDLEASFSLLFARSPYELPPSSDLPRTLGSAAAAAGAKSSTVGMTFWTDAAILGEAGIPSVLFGPGGAGLHSLEEYVRVSEVIMCRDALASLAMMWP
jgi:acetylornithine deacetylase